MSERQDSLQQYVSDMLAGERHLNFLMDYTPLIAEINEVVPEVVVSELRDETEILDPNAVTSAVKRTQEAWTNHHVHSGREHAR